MSDKRSFNRREKQRDQIRFQKRDAERIAWDLMETDPCLSDLELIIESLPKLRKEAAARVLNMNPDRRALGTVMMFVPECREEAAKHLIDHHPSAKSMCKVIRFCKSMREEAWAKLVLLGPSNTQLCFVMEVAEELREEAMALLQQTSGHDKFPELAGRGADASAWLELL